MDLQLRGRVILVVGGNGFIGTAITERLRSEGAAAVVAARGEGADIRMDAQDDHSVAAGFTRLLAQHGRLDAVVVAAAPSARTLDPDRNGDPAQVLEAVDAKTLVFLRVATAALPSMKKAGYGRIVGVSGQNAFVTGNIAGSVRNAALIIVAKNLADAVAGSGITVNTVSPGLVSLEPTATVEPGRSGESTPDQIADLVAFLVSPLAAGISGESIAVGHRVRGVANI